MSRPDIEKMTDQQIASILSEAEKGGYCDHPYYDRFRYALADRATARIKTSRASKGGYGQMTKYQSLLAKRAPEMNPAHMESLAFAVGSTLDDMPKEFFDEVAMLARQMGPGRLAQIHATGVIA